MVEKGKRDSVEGDKEERRANWGDDSKPRPTGNFHYVCANSCPAVPPDRGVETDKF